jgi:3-oxoacyl-[acyl-carrier-protein] synthase-3
MENIYMDGAAVLDFVKKDVPFSIRQLLAESGLSLENIVLVVFHQASKITIDYLNRVMHIPEEKQFTNLIHLGNTVSASIPIALRDAELQGKIRSGMQVLVVGFGVGLSWGSCLIKWN